MLMADIAEELADLAGEGRVTRPLMEELAAELEVELYEVVAATAMNPALALDRPHGISVDVCIGRCQFGGGIPILQSLLELQKEWEDAGRSGFNLACRGCLDVCDFAPAVRIAGPHGVLVERFATSEGITEILSELCSP
jgi:NADH:ubiquinone oxidoreductase subunit E